MRLNRTVTVAFLGTCASDRAKKELTSIYAKSGSPFYPPSYDDGFAVWGELGDRMLDRSPGNYSSRHRDGLTKLLRAGLIPCLVGMIVDFAPLVKSISLDEYLVRRCKR